jgi:DNA-binding NtrC family response regulator
MLELRLQVEELRRRLDTERDHREVFLGNGREVQPPALGSGASNTIAIEAPDQAQSPSQITLAPGMTMAQIERAAIEAALRETRGNRRKAAEILDIGERTLYRKLRDYGIAPEGATAEATR